MADVSVCGSSSFSLSLPFPPSLLPSFIRMIRGVWGVHSNIVILVTRQAGLGWRSLEKHTARRGVMGG